MGSEFEYDSLRKKLDTENLSDTERKEMLKIFADAGGKVLEERELEQDTKHTIYTESDDKNYLSNGSSSKSRTNNHFNQTTIQSEKNTQKFGIPSKAKKNIEKETKQSKTPTTLNRLLLQFQSVLGGITNFSVNYYKSQFLFLIKFELSKILLELNLIGEHLFSHSNDVSTALIENIKEKDPRLLYIFSRLFLLSDNKIIKQLSLAIDLEQEDHISANETYKNIKNLYNQLYPFLSITKMIQYNLEWLIKEFYKSSPSIHSQKFLKNLSTTLTKNLNILFRVIPTKILILVNLVEKKRMVPFTQDFENEFPIDSSLNFLNNSNNQDDLLFYKSSEPEQNHLEEKLSQDDQDDEHKSKSSTNDNKPDKEEEPSSKEYQFGKVLFNNLNLENLRSKFNPEETWKQINYNIDTTTSILLYLLEFDSSYLFHIVNKDIQITYLLQDNKKIDFFKIFSEEKSSIYKLKTDFSLYINSISDLNNFLKHNTKIQENNKRKSMFQNEILQKRLKIETQMSKIITSLFKNISIIIKNLQVEKKEIYKIVKNRNSKIQLNGKDVTVESTIIQFYCYITYLKEYLEKML